MKTVASIRRVEDIFRGKSADLPEQPGVYAFWWIAPKDELIGGNRHVVLKGPGGQPVDVEYRDWWPDDLVYPCLYVGKTTNIRKRFLTAHHARNQPPITCLSPWQRKGKALYDFMPVALGY